MHDDLCTTHRSWAASMYTCHETDLIQLDFSTAIDCVPHQRLIHKLDYYGISGRTLCWVKSFLSNRNTACINKWSHSALNFNPSTFHLLTITHKPKPSEFTYTISNQPISRVNSHPYLGVTIDAKLSWTKHIQSIASKSAKTLGLLKRTL